ncbi:MAG: hypothetical protein V4539_19115 [Bacteroidota bacterium]
MLILVIQNPAMNESMNMVLAHEQFVQALNPEAPLSKEEKTRLLEQADQLPFHWIRTAYQNAKKHSMRLAVQLAQQGTQLLLEQLHNRLSKTNSPFYEHLQERLTRFINYLRKNCEAYFDTRSPMPDHMWLTIRTQVDERLNPSDDSVLADTDLELAGLLRNQYQQTTQPATPSYHIAGYWQQLTVALAAKLPAGDPTLHTIYTLVACNFNCTVFIKYLLHRFANALPAEGDANNEWAEHLHHINRIIEVPGMCFDTRLQPCKELLFADISNEMRLNSFSRHAAVAFGAPVSFKTSLSGSQLALLYRLLFDCGIIQVESKQQLMEQLAQVYQTPSGAISARHLKDKFYMIEPSAIEVMKNHAVEMINLLRKYSNA